MPIHHAVLALLAEGPSHGYELKASFERAIGPQWGELNIGHLHQILERLQRDGFVRSRLVPQTDRPDKTVYRLNKAGRAELDRWLAAPFVREGGYRDDFFLKLFAASRIGSDQLRSVIDIQREAYTSELRALGELRARHLDDPLISLLVEAAILHTEANLSVAESARSRARRLFERAGAITGGGYQQEDREEHARRAVHS